ncbi:MAG: hypothetical protein V7682_11870 [Cycloclasticus sp.]
MNRDYKTLARLFFDICLLKKGPQDVPDSSDVRIMVFISYLVAGSVLISSGLPWSDAVYQTVIETFLVAFFMYVLLLFFSLPNRFKQAITAIYGSGTLITTLSIPFVFWLDALIKSEESTGVAGLAVFVVVSWSFIVMGHIIRETIQKSMAISLLLTFCYLYLSYQVIIMLFPVTEL